MIRINVKMTRTFNPESYGKLLASFSTKNNYHGRRKRAGDRTRFNLRTSSQSYTRRGDTVGSIGDIN